MAFNYSAYSDSSDESPHQSYSIKLSDLGATNDGSRPHPRKIAEKPETVESKELTEAFRSIDGPPQVLQHAVEREKMKALLAGQHPKTSWRHPPPPPVLKNEETKSRNDEYTHKQVLRPPPTLPPRRRPLEDRLGAVQNRQMSSRQRDAVSYSPLKPADPTISTRRSDVPRRGDHNRDAQLRPVSEDMRENPLISVPMMNARARASEGGLPLEHRSEASQRGEAEYLRMRIRQLEAEKSMLQQNSFTVPAGEDTKPPSKSKDAMLNIGEAEKEQEREFARRLAEAVEAVEEKCRSRIRELDLQWEEKIQEVNMDCEGKLLRATQEIAALKDNFGIELAQQREESNRRLEEAKADLDAIHQADARRVEEARRHEHEAQINDVIHHQEALYEERVRGVHESYRMKEAEDAQVLTGAVERFGASILSVNKECELLLASCNSELDIYDCLFGALPAMRSVFDCGLVQLWVLDDDGSSYHCVVNSHNESTRRRAEVRSIHSLERDFMLLNIGSDVAANVSLSRKVIGDSRPRNETVRRILSTNKSTFDPVADVMSAPFRRKGQSGSNTGRQFTVDTTAFSSIYCATLMNITVDNQDGIQNIPTGFILAGEEHYPIDASADAADMPIAIRYAECHRESALLEVIRKLRDVVNGSYRRLSMLQAVEHEKVLRGDMELELQAQYAVGRLKDKFRNEAVDVQGVADKGGLKIIQHAATTLASACVNILGCTEAWIVLDVHNDDDPSDELRRYVVITALEALPVRSVEESSRSDKSSLFDMVRCGGGSSGGVLPKPALISTTRRQLYDVGLTLPTDQADRSVISDKQDENIQLMIVPFSADFSLSNCSAVVLLLPSGPVLHQDLVLKCVDVLTSGFSEGFVHVCKMYSQNLQSVVNKAIYRIFQEVGCSKHMLEQSEFVDHDTTTLLAACSGDVLADIFGAERSYLLISGEVSGAVRLKGDIHEDRSDYFVAYNGHDDDARRVPVDSGFNNRWLDTLSSGRHIYVSSFEDGRKDKKELNDFLRCIDSDIRCAVLIPLTTARGLCIFVLVNSQADHDDFSSDDSNLKSFQFLAKSVFPTLNDVAKIVNASSFGQSVSGFIEAAYDKNTAAANDKTMIVQMKETVQKYARRLQWLDSKYVMTVSFQQWRRYCSHRSRRACVSRISNFSTAIKKLLDMSTHSPRESDRFQQEVEAALLLLFPQDVLIVSDSEASDRGHRLLRSGQVNEEEPSQLRRTLSCLESGAIIACVTLIRTKSHRAYEEEEMRMLDSICQLAEISYLHSRRPEVKNSAVQTDNEVITEVVKYVSSPIIPFLLKALPLLFNGSDILDNDVQISHRESDEAYVASAVVKWVKALSNADVALLRIKPTDGSSQEMLISSEDSYSVVPSTRNESNRTVHDLVLDTTSETDTHTGNCQIVMKLLGINGELKLIGTREESEDVFCEDASTVAAIASYLLVTSTLLRRKRLQYSNEVASARTAVADMEALVEESHAQTDVVVGRAEDLSRRIGITRRLAEFSVELFSCKQISEFADLIWSSFPRAFRVKAANLFIRQSASGSSDFDAIFPTSVHMGTQDTDFEEKISWVHLKKIPIFDRNLKGERIAPSRRSKILIVNSLTQDVLGAIVLLQEVTKDDVLAHPDWDATEHLFVEIVASYMSRMLIAHEYEKNVAQKRVPLEKFELLQQEKAALADELDASNHEVSGLVEELSRSKLDREQLNAKLKTLSTECASQQALANSRCDQLEMSLRSMEDEFDQRLQKLKSQYVSECTRGEELSNAIQQLESMVMGFAVDTRLQPQHVLGWMYEFADKFDAQVYSVCRSVGGELMVPAGGALGVSSAVCGAAADAIRDYKPVEVLVSLSDPHISTSVRTRSSSGSRVHNPAVILCIPNRLASGSTTREYDPSSDSDSTVCYVFVRHGDQKFSLFERSFLNCVTGLTAKTLAVYEGAKQKYPENIERLLALASAESIQVARLKHAVAYSTRQWSSSLNSWNEFVTAAEMGGRAILSYFPPSPSPTSPSQDIFVVECCLWEPGSKSPIFSVERHKSNAKATALITSSFENDIVAHRVMSNGRSHRNGNTMWIPLKTQSGEVVALLYAERKIDFRRVPPEYSSAEEHDVAVGGRTSPREGVDSRFITHSSGDMVFSEMEEEMMNLFSSMAAGAINSLIHQHETLQSVKKASRAILALQTTQTNLESRLAQEIALKLKFEEGLKMGSDIMSSLIIKRMDVAVLLDTVRKSLVTLVSCKDCFIMTPFLPDEVSTPAHRSEVGDRMYTLAIESGETIEVQLEPMDIEYVALKSRRPCKNSAVGDHQSWGARNCVVEKWTAAADAAGPSEDSVLYSLAVPCGLRNGSTVIVVVLRYDHDFDVTDEMCMFWLTKILSCSIDIHHDETDARYFRRQLELTQGDLQRTQEDCKRATLQLSEKLEQAQQRDQEEEIFFLRKAIGHLTDEAKESLKLASSDSSLYCANQTDINSAHVPCGVDLIAHCAKVVFRHSNVEVWSSGETSTRVREMDALLLDTRERLNRDHITAGNTKIVVWEETAVAFDGQGAGMHIKAVITDLDLSELPIWLKIRKHDDDIPPVYRIKILLMLRMAFDRDAYCKQVKGVMTLMESAKEEMVSAHAREIDALMLEVRTHEQTQDDANMQFRSQILTLKSSHNSELAANKARYKTSMRDVLKERLVLCEYVKKIAIAEKFVLSCGSITRSEDKRTPKKLNIAKMIRKLCEVLNQDGVLDVAAAFVKRVEGSGAQRERGRHNRINAETTHLTWISPSTHWVGTSSPMTSNSPIGAAYLEKRIVYTATSDESAAGALAVDSNNPKLDVNPSDYMPFVSDAFPELTLIVPVTFPHQDEEYILVVKPVIRASGGGVFSPPLGVNITSWLTLRTCLATAANLNFTLHADVKQRKMTALSGVLRDLNQKTTVLRLRELGRAFAFLKATWLMDRLSAYSFDDHKYTMARKHIRVLERSVADWTELVKGVNGASGGVALGLRGLWGQACRPLMSMITSHVTLRGCGLMVASEDGDVMDLNVEALSSVDDVPAAYPDENDLAATVSIRPASEMGSGLQTLALNILNGQTVISGSGSVQRLWKLSRSEGKGMRFGVHEQMWLVPLRTATEVLGIVRVFVDISSDLSHDGDHPRHDYGEFQDYSEESSTEYGWGGGGAESAKRNLINFAEVLAPMVTAARLIEVSRAHERECEQDVEESEHQRALFRREVDTLSRRVSMICRCVEEVQRATVKDLEGEEANMEVLQVLKKRLDMPLSVTLGIEVSIIPGNIRKEHLLRQESSENVHIVDITLADDTIVGYIRAVMPTNHFNDIEGDNVSDIAPADATVNVGDSLIAPAAPSHLHIDISSVNTTLEVVASCISSTFAVLDRELEAKAKVTKAVENLHTMQHELEDQIQLRQEFSYKEIVSSETSAFNFKVADIMRSCALFESGFSWEEAEMKSIAGKDMFSEAQGIGGAMESLFKTICGDLSNLFRQSCVFNVGVDQNISVLDGSSDDAQHVTGKDRQLIWYSSEGRGIMRFPEEIAVEEDSIRIVENLGAACIAQNKRSCVDIEIDREISLLEESTNFGVKVLSYPLCPPRIDSTPLQPVGVLQVLCPISLDKSEVEALCDAISLALAGVIRNDRARMKLLQRVCEFTTANSILSNSLEEASSDAQCWRRRFTAWNAVGVALKGLAQDCQESAEGIYKLLPADMRAMLKSYGITIAATRGDEYDSDDSGVSQSGESEYLFSLQRDAVVNSAEVHVVCKFNAELIPVEDQMPLFETIRECICCLHGLILAQKRTVAEHSDVVSQLHNKIKALQQDCVLSNDQCRLLSEKLHIASKAVNDQSNRIVTIKGRIPRAVEGVLRPLSADISSLLRPEGHKQNGIDIELSSSLLDKLFSSYADIISNGIDRVVSCRTRPFHVSVLVKTVSREKLGNVKNLGNGVVMYEKNRSTGSTFSDSEFSEENAADTMHDSCVYKCFATGMAQSFLCQGQVYSLSPFDLIGISAKQLTALSALEAHSSKSVPVQSTVMTVPLHTDIIGLTALVRVIYTEERKGRSSEVSGSAETDDGHKTVVQAILDTLCSLSASVARVFHEHQRRSELEEEIVNVKQHWTENVDSVQQQLTKFRKIYKVVCREVSALFDPPVVDVSVNGVSQKLPSHPAALSPLVALQDTCLKTLSIIRSIAHSEGQAILLKDPDSTSNTFQIIYTGNSLYWPGIDAGSFGMVSSPTSVLSLAGTCMNSHKSMIVTDAKAERSYAPRIDGQCAERTPLLLVPIRGRGGGVVGVVIIARGAEARAFAVEDAVAVELAASFSSLSLFWSSGLGYIHQKLSSSVAKIEELEESMKLIKHPQKKK